MAMLMTQSTRHLWSSWGAFLWQGLHPQGEEVSFGVRGSKTSDRHKAEG